jgi:hypothetical protein
MNMRKLFLRAAALFESMVASFKVDLSPAALEGLFPGFKPKRKRARLERGFRRESTPQRLRLELLPRTGTDPSPRQPEEPVLFPFPRHRFHSEVPSPRI